MAIGLDYSVKLIMDDAAQRHLARLQGAGRGRPELARELQEFSCRIENILGEAKSKIECTMGLMDEAIEKAIKSSSDV